MTHRLQTYKPTRFEQKRTVFANLAANISELSTCKRRKVGCVIVDKAFTQVMAVGYNGPPAGLPHDVCSAAELTCGCVHAEMNAIAKLSVGSVRSDLLLITTVSPCVLCAGLIINCPAINAVHYLSEYRLTAGIELLKSAGIELNA